MDDIIDVGVSDSEMLAELPEVDEPAKQAEEQAEVEYRDLQNLAKSAAWVKVRGEFQKKIEAIEKFDFVDFDGETNEQVGEQCKVHKLLASELRGFMAKIDNSVEKGGLDDGEE